MSPDKFTIQDRLWVISEPVGVRTYDFEFRQFFDCRTPYDPPSGLPGVARIGAFQDYSKLFSECAKAGIDLVHSPDEHQRCTSLPIWYSLIQDYTPRSCWYSEIPSFNEVESAIGLPVFVKGSRQTSKHKAAASIIRSREDFELATQIFRSDPILRWQDFVCRELLELKPVAGGVEEKIPASFEFRTFFQLRVDAENFPLDIRSALACGFLDIRKELMANAAKLAFLFARFLSFRLGALE
ncbi:MAG: hypothetical protein ACI8UO_005510 [Verrucomicrobiales bacterium]|jgi:hypothetical protein